MSLGLETDVSNTNFSNAVQNPDTLMHVEFYMHAPVDKWSSQEAQKRVLLPEQPFVRIMRPGDKESIIETPVREDHKMRWPQKWLYFAMQNGMAEGSMDIPGWKVQEWPELQDQPEMVRELQFNRFLTVEQIAGASDAQVQRIGMAGMGLREKAKRALQGRMSEATQQAIAERDTKIAEQASTIETQGKDIAELKEMMQQVLAKRGPGRPPNQRDD